MQKEILYFDDFISDISYFDDISLKRTIYFFIQHNDSIDNKLSKLADMLFTIDVNDNSVFYFQKKNYCWFHACIWKLLQIYEFIKKYQNVSR